MCVCAPDAAIQHAACPNVSSQLRAARANYAELPATESGGKRLRIPFVMVIVVPALATMTDSATMNAVVSDIYSENNVLFKFRS